MFLTQKIRIFPTNSQQHLLWNFSEKCRLLYNFALQERKQNWMMQQKITENQRKYLRAQKFLAGEQVILSHVKRDRILTSCKRF